MKIIPKTDILIAGEHCAAGKAVEVEGKLGASLVVQGFADKQTEDAEEELKPKKK